MVAPDLTPDLIARIISSFPRLIEDDFVSRKDLAVFRLSRAPPPGLDTEAHLLSFGLPPNGDPTRKLRVEEAVSRVVDAFYELNGTKGDPDAEGPGDDTAS